MRFIRKILFLFIFVATSSSVEAGNNRQTLEEKMVPHKALYDIKMVSKRSGAQVVNVSGQMFYEWRPGCDAWTTDHRFNLFYEYTDSSPIRITSDFSTYETYDGKSFDYTSRRKRDGKLYQEVRGRAEMKDDGTGEALYTSPKSLAFELKKNTLFPMAHSLEILKLAQKGKRFYNTTIFDGSDEDGAVEVNVFIGKKVNAIKMVEANPKIDTALVDTEAWKIRMAFFPLIKPAANAEYEMDVIFHENGVISDMLVEYSDFSVTQKLTALEKLESENCKKTKKN